MTASAIVCVLADHFQHPEYAPAILGTIKDLRQAVQDEHDDWCGCTYRLGDARQVSIEKQLCDHIDGGVPLPGDLTEDDFAKCHVKPVLTDCHTQPPLRCDTAVSETFSASNPNVIQVLFVGKPLTQEASTLSSQINALIGSKRKRPNDEIETFQLTSSFSPAQTSSSSSPPSSRAPSRLVSSKRRKLVSMPLVFCADEEMTHVGPPLLTSNFTSLSSDPTQIYVDKSIAVRIIRPARRQFEPRVPVIRRPEGSGLRTFVSMVCEYHDYLSNASESGLFERLPAGQILEKSRDSIVLRFDLADPSIYTTSPFSQGLIDYIQRQMSAVEVKYRDVLLDYRPPLYSTSTKDHILFAFLDSLQRFQRDCRRSLGLFISVENYTAPWQLVREQDRATLFATLDYILFSPLVDPGTHNLLEGVIVTGRPLSAQPNGSSIQLIPNYHPFLDLTEDPALFQTFGLTTKEIETLYSVWAKKEPGDELWKAIHAGAKPMDLDKQKETFFPSLEKTLEHEDVYHMRDVLPILSRLHASPNQTYECLT